MQNSPGINLPGANNAKSSTTGAGAGSPWREIPVVRTGQRRLASRPLPNGRRMHPNCLKQGLDDRAISLAENWTGETGVQTKFLHLFGDFSQPAISRHGSGNSADISKRYFQNCTASSSPTWSASKSLILQRESGCRQFARHSRRSASAFARIPN
jgi:hypothetical protein